MSSESASAADATGSLSKRKSDTHEERQLAKRKKHHVPADFVVVGVLWQQDGEHYRKFKYGPNTLGKDWRDQSNMQQTGTLKQLNGADHTSVLRTLRPALFGTGGALKAFPLYGPIQAAAVGDDDNEHETVSLETQLRLRMARRQCGFLKGRDIKPPEDEELAAVNRIMEDIFITSQTGTTKTFTKEEFVCWIFHELPLTGDTEVCYQTQMSEYMRLTNDVHDLLFAESSIIYNSTFLSIQQLKLKDLLRMSVVGGIGPIIKKQNKWGELHLHQPSRPLLSHHPLSQKLPLTFTLYVGAQLSSTRATSSAWCCRSRRLPSPTMRAGRLRSTSRRPTARWFS